MKKKIFLSLLLVGLVFSINGCGLVKQSKSTTLTIEEREKLDKLLGEAGPPSNLNVSELPIVTPEALWSAFEENPLKAEQVYKNKWIKLRGNITSGPLKTEVLGVSTYKVTLAHKNIQISCLFAGKIKEEQLLPLKTGQEIIVVGRYATHDSGPFLILCSIAN